MGAAIGIAASRCRMVIAPVIDDSLGSVDTAHSWGTRAGSGNHAAAPVVKSFRSDDDHLAA
jgi:hypothetical protein